MSVKRTSRLLGLVAAGLLAAGCGDRDAPGSGVETVVDTVDGVVHVRNRGEPTEWRLEPAVEIGLAAAGGTPDPREFGRVHGIAVDREGRLWIGDAQAREVRVFTPEGGFVAAFGRAGQGPGEMNSLQSLAWLGADTLALLDSAQGRVLLFSPDGASLGQFGYPGGVTGPPDFVRFYPTSPEEVYAFAPDGAGGRIFQRYSAGGQEGALPMRQPEDLAAEGGTTVCPLPDLGLRFFTVPFAPQSLLRPVAGGLVLAARTDELRFVLVDGEGRAVRVVEDHLAPIPVTDADWEEATADWRAWRAENPGIRCDNEPVRPRLQPPLVDVHPDAEARLWAEVRSERGPGFRVYDAEGRLVARAGAPPRSRRIPPSFAPGWMAVLAEGPLGEDVIRLYRIQEDGGP